MYEVWILLVLFSNYSRIFRAAVPPPTPWFHPSLLFSLSNNKIIHQTTNYKYLATQIQSNPLFGCRGKVRRRKKIKRESEFNNLTVGSSLSRLSAFPATKQSMTQTMLHLQTSDAAFGSKSKYNEIQMK